MWGNLLGLGSLYFHSKTCMCIYNAATHLLYTHNICICYMGIKEVVFCDVKVIIYRVFFFLFLFKRKFD